MIEQGFPAPTARPDTFVRMEIAGLTRGEKEEFDMDCRRLAGFIGILPNKHAIADVYFRSETCWKLAATLLQPEKGKMIIAKLSNYFVID